MSDLPPKQLKGLFFAIEVNLVLWIIVAGTVYQSSAELFAKVATVAGFLLATILQHWAYYHLYRRAKQNLKQGPLENRL